MSSLTPDSMPDLSELQQKVERLQNNLVPQVESLRNRLEQLENLQCDINSLKRWFWVGILIPIIIAIMTAPYLLSSPQSCLDPAAQQEGMHSQGWSFVVGNYSKIAVVDGVTNAQLLVSEERKGYHKMPENVDLQCELESNASGEALSMHITVTNCTLKREETGQYEISYHLPLRPGKYKLRISKINGEFIRGDAFTVHVLKEFNITHINTITGLKAPQGITFNVDRGNMHMLVAEYREHSISICNSSGWKESSFGSIGYGPGQFNHPSDVAVDDDGNVLVADTKNHRIQKFEFKPDPTNGTLPFITEVGRQTTPPLDFDLPVGIAIHPHTKMVYITENKKTNFIRILYPNLTLAGSVSGEFNEAKDIAFDSDGNIYVADNENHRIQVFTSKGDLVRQFGKRGEGKGELKYPSGITIDGNGFLYVTELYNYRVSVFTVDGEFITSFGTKGNEPGQFIDPRGIAVDKNGTTIYVSDHGNDRIQVYRVIVVL